MGQRDRLIEVAAKVKALRDELRQWEGELDRLLRGQPTELLGRKKGPTKGIARDVVAALEAEPARVFSAETLTLELANGASLHTVRSTLSRLAKDGQIEKVDRGQYRAPQRDEEGAAM